MGELGITAGLQDRVIQIYEGMVTMDFAQEEMREENGLKYGKYERIVPEKMPPIYLAYKDDAGEPTEVVHNNLRHLWETGDERVHAAMKRFAQLTDSAKTALAAGDWPELSRLMDANYDLRRSICQIAPKQQEMIDVARSVGVSAKFAGSGGAIIGICQEDSTYEKLCAELRKIQCRVLRPEVFGK